jgi:hypothetical protein
MKTRVLEPLNNIAEAGALFLWVGELLRAIITKSVKNSGQNRKKYPVRLLVLELLTSEYLLQLANRAYDLLMSSEAEEKRQLLQLTLQNLKLDGKRVEFELVKPFDKVFACASSQTWLPELDSNQQPSG